MLLNVNLEDNWIKIQYNDSNSSLVLISKKLDFFERNNNIYNF